ncbi:MAG: glycerophosphodiester phosphodiesterase family protein [Caldilineaceae bacterium]
MPTITPTSRPLLIVGHRGAKEVVPENTLLAFQFAIAAGVDAIELDVHLSKDGELMVMHDATIERTTDGRGAIRDFTVAELKQFNAAAQLAGNEPGKQIEIPTLQEVYDFVQGRVPINLEIKQGPDGRRYPQIEEQIITLVRRNRAIDLTVLSSFDFPTLATVQTLAPDILNHAIVARDYFQTPGLETPEAVVADLVDRGVHWVAINKGYLTRTLVNQLHDQGIFVHVWVINEEEELQGCVALGVDAITTDRPDRIVPLYRAMQAT